MAGVHVYLADGFEEIELVSIVDVLRRSAIDVTMVALDGWLEVRGAHGILVRADLPFSGVTEAPDVIVLPGGGPGSERLLGNGGLAERLRARLAADGRVAAICAAPRVLAAAGVLRGRRACCYPGCEADLIAGGAQVCAYNVVTDGPVTTSRGPGTSALFALELVRLLASEERAREIGRAMLVI